MRSYKALNKQVYKSGEYSIVPIRDEDRYDIMRWRNEQVYHLRQNGLLTKQQQDKYFDTVVAKLFEQERPTQILFSFLKGDVCVGYGGLVHMNWIDKNAETSFVMNTLLEKTNFIDYWVIFLNLIKKVAFEELDMHKIFTYAFDIRPKLYKALKVAKFKEEARLLEHSFVKNKFKDVLIHSYLNPRQLLKYRLSNKYDAKLVFNWANENEVRNNALIQDKILWEDHLHWFLEKIKSKTTHIYIFSYGDKVIGQVRLDRIEDFWKIDYSIDKTFRGRGFGTLMLKTIIDLPTFKSFNAIVRGENIPSFNIFKILGFEEFYSKQDDLYTFSLRK